MRRRVGAYRHTSSARHALDPLPLAAQSCYRVFADMNAETTGSCAGPAASCGRKTASAPPGANPNKATYWISSEALKNVPSFGATATATALGIPYWPSRDPIGERGGSNLYGFVENDGVNWVDVLGFRKHGKSRRAKGTFYGKKRVKTPRQYAPGSREGQARKLDEKTREAKKKLEEEHGKYDPKKRRFEKGTKEESRKAIEDAITDILENGREGLLPDFLGGIPFGGGDRAALYGLMIRDCDRERARAILENRMTDEDPSCCYFFEFEGINLGDARFLRFESGAFVPCKSCDEVTAMWDETGTVDKPVPPGQERTTHLIDY